MHHIVLCASRSRGAIVDVLPDTFDFLNLDGSVFYQDMKVDMNTYLSRESRSRDAASKTKFRDRAL